MFKRSKSLTLCKSNQSMAGRGSIYQLQILVKYNYYYNPASPWEYTICVHLYIIILIQYKIHLKNTEHHYRWNMHMKINKCMHDTFHGRLWVCTSIQHNHSQLTKLKMIVFQEFGKYCISYLAAVWGLIKNINNLSYE